MDLFKWTPRLATGIPMIDLQHKALLDAVNALHDAMRAGQGSSALAKTLDFLLKYTEQHFSAEEALMRQHKYAALHAHKAIHDGMVRQVRELLAAHRAGKPVLTLAVAEFVGDWVQKHIEGEDLKFAQHVRASAPPPPAR